MEQENGNGNTVLLTVIGVATLLVALVGATFAYFSANINSTSKESIILTTKAPTGLTYAVDGEALILENATPGQSKEGKFTVYNGDTTTTQTYDVELVVNALADTTKYFTITDETLLTGYLGTTPTQEQITQGADQLTVTILSATSDKADRTITVGTSSVNLTDGAAAVGSHKLVQTQEIAPGETHTYTIKVDFKNYDFKQDNNQGKTLDAYIDITNPRSISSTSTGE